MVDWAAPSRCRRKAKVFPRHRLSTNRKPYFNGLLGYLARVRTGFTDAERRRLASVLAAARVRSRPVVPCPEKGHWLEPELLCQVNYLEKTRAGRLRGASFHGLLGGYPWVQ